MTWTQGRRLASITQNGVITSYEYNVNGIRTKKTVGEEVYNMLLSDDTLIGVEYEDVYTLIFLRDDSDRIIGFRQYSTNGTLLETYYYEFNVQGDVVALYDSSKAIVAKYTYDSWGKLLSVTNASGSVINAGGHVAIVNPIRYRGYYYDNETGFYYLNSRYYDPATRRFINADGLTSTGQGFVGFNMYAYCLNNPVNNYDPSGTYAGKCMNGFVVPGSSGYWVNYEIPQIEVVPEPEQKPTVDMESHTFEQMSICTDGGKDTYGSTTHQDRTAYQINGISMDPSIVNYVVAPSYYNKVKNGDIAVVIDHTTGKYVYAIVGDRGPTDGNFHEVSLKVAWDLGYSEANGRRGPKGNFETIVFYNSSKKWNSIDELVEGLEDYARQYYP